MTEKDVKKMTYDELIAAIRTKFGENWTSKSKEMSEKRRDDPLIAEWTSRIVQGK